MRTDGIKDIAARLRSRLPKLPRRRWQRVLVYVFGSFLLVAIGWWAFTPKPPLLDGVNFSTAVLDRHGTLLRLSLSADEKYRVFTPLDEISGDLKEATLLYEDRHFYRHPGVNPLALVRAVSTIMGGGRRMGASTITMQLARLRLGLKTDTVWGKVLQIERALAYERYYSKDQILEAYLNLAPYGSNIEGCGAASEIYFHKNAAYLSLAECLALVSVPQNPTRRNPLAVRKMEMEGRVDPAFDDARSRIYQLWLDEHPEDAGAGFVARGRLEVHTPASLPFKAPHVTTEALTRFPRETRVRTTIDMRQQSQIEKMVGGMVQRNFGLGVQNAGAMLVHWPSMEVRALVGSADFFNEKIEGQVDATKARRSPGSTLKTVIYAMALDQGLIHPGTVLYDMPKDFRGYEPENADQEFKGPISARLALQMSRNIPAISLANRLRNPNLYEFLKDCGVNFDYGSEHYGLSLVLGGAEVSMRELAVLYSMLANRGQLRSLVLFPGLEEPGEPRRVLSPESTFLALDMIRLIPTMQRLRHGRLVGRVPMYWKTGTSNGMRDAWTAGVFGPYVLVVWVGNFDNTPNPNFLGIKLAAPLFWDIADAVYGMEKIRDMVNRNLDSLNLTRVKVCTGTGDIDNGLCPDVAESWFIPGVSPIYDSGVYREILIDNATGLRACVEDPEKTRKVVWEFWPTDMQQVFLRAGVKKPAPPRFLPECGSSSGPSGLPPEILSPKDGVTYHRSLTRPEGTVITLHASGDADATEFFWFAGTSFIGRSRPEEHIVWTPPGGVTVIKVIDNFGRTSTRRINVELTE